MKENKNENNLLIMDITKGDGWSKLCNFLNKPIPNKPFPRAKNTTIVMEKWCKKLHKFQNRINYFIIAVFIIISYLVYKYKKRKNK